MELPETALAGPAGAGRTRRPRPALDRARRGAKPGRIRGARLAAGRTRAGAWPGRIERVGRRPRPMPAASFRERRDWRAAGSGRAGPTGRRTARAPAGRRTRRGAGRVSDRGREPSRNRQPGSAASPTRAPGGTGGSAGRGGGRPRPGSGRGEGGRERRRSADAFPDRAPRIGPARARPGDPVLEDARGSKRCSGDALLARRAPGDARRRRKSEPAVAGFARHFQLALRFPPPLTEAEREVARALARDFVLMHLLDGPASRLEPLAVRPFALGPGEDTALIVEPNRLIEEVGVGRGPVAGGRRGRQRAPGGRAPEARPQRLPRDLERGWRSPSSRTRCCSCRRRRTRPDPCAGARAGYLAPTLDDFIFGFVFAGVDAEGRLQAQADANRVRLGGQALFTDTGPRRSGRGAGWSRSTRPSRPEILLLVLNRRLLTDAPHEARRRRRGGPGGGDGGPRGAHAPAPPFVPGGQGHGGARHPSCAGRAGPHRRRARPARRRGAHLRPGASGCASIARRGRCASTRSRSIGARCGRSTSSASRNGIGRRKAERGDARTRTRSRIRIRARFRKRPGTCPAAVRPCHVSASTGHRVAGLLGSPATGVDFLGAALYCEAVGGRLPWAEELEAAAAGREGRLYAWGDEFDPGRMALPRRLPQRIPALRRVPALGFAGGGARPQRQRDGVERRELRRAARRPPPGGARGARGALPVPRDLCAQRRVAAHRTRDPEPPPRLPLRLRRPAARRTSLGRPGGAPRAYRGRGVPHRPSPRRAPGASRPDPARLPAPRCPRPARVLAVGRAPDRESDAAR